MVQAGFPSVWYQIFHRFPCPLGILPLKWVPQSWAEPPCWFSTPALAARENNGIKTATGGQSEPLGPSRRLDPSMVVSGLSSLCLWPSRGRIRGAAERGVCYKGSRCDRCCGVLWWRCSSC